MRRDPPLIRLRRSVDTTRRDFVRHIVLAGLGAGVGVKLVARAPAAPLSAIQAPLAAAPVRSPLVGVDIGTSKVCVVVGEGRPDGTINILGLGQAPSRGV